MKAGRALVAFVVVLDVDEGPAGAEEVVVLAVEGPAALEPVIVFASKEPAVIILAINGPASAAVGEEVVVAVDGPTVIVFAVDGPAAIEDVFVLALNGPAAIEGGGGAPNNFSTTCLSSSAKFAFGVSFTSSSESFCSRAPCSSPACDCSGPPDSPVPAAISGAFSITSGGFVSLLK